LQWVERPLCSPPLRGGRSPDWSAAPTNLMAIVDGQQFDRLTALRPVRTVGNKGERLCACLCGKLVWIRSDKLALRRSCGCIAAEARERAARPPEVTAPKRAAVPDHLRSTHGSWRSMRSRCSSFGTKYYAGRGVSVCARWRESFDAFVEDVGPRPSLKHSLDRYPNRDGNYEPGNCRWATSKEQNNNRRPRTLKVVLPFEGRNIGVAELAQRTGLKKDAIRQRIDKGWSAERILSTPPRVWPGGRYGRDAMKLTA